MPRWWPRALVLLALAAPAFAAEPRMVVLQVEGMNCSLCPVTVRKALERVPGVLEARVDLEAGRAQAKYDPDKATPQALAAAVTNAGFRARVKQP
jgi:periplasmic mercuric ion binding protein